MLGFNQPKKTAVPAAQAGGILVTREDIYRENKGMEPILLLRKGYEVTPEELPRFIRNGAKPHQFQFKHTEEPLRAYQLLPKPPIQSTPAPVLLRRTQPASDPPDTLSIRPQTGNRKKVLILEPDPKSMKRLIDCLFICGVPLDRIHPVRLAEHLNWVAEKYRPNVLVVDYALPGSAQTGLDVLTAVQHLPWLERCILTVNPNQMPPKNDNWQALEAICQERNIRLLVKPVNRRTLNRLLTE
jgi:hypothetical protein